MILANILLHIQILIYEIQAVHYTREREVGGGGISRDGRWRRPRKWALGSVVYIYLIISVPSVLQTASQPRTGLGPRGFS
jgi:hypothetical protein